MHESEFFEIRLEVDEARYPPGYLARTRNI